MKLITRQLPANHNLFLFGDLHDGSVLSWERGWKTMIKAIKSPYDGCSNNYAAEGGDMMEAITIDDRRFGPEKLTEPLPLVQVKRAVEKREDIMDLLLYLLDGNHELKLWRFGNLTADVCEKLNKKLEEEGKSHRIEYGTYTVKLRVEDSKGRLMYKLFDTHGSRSITSTADDPVRRRTNLELILKRQLKRKAGDCAVMIKHHVHKLIVCKPEGDLYLTDDGKRIRSQYTSWGQNEKYIQPDARWYGCAGSFLRLYGDGISGYAEIAEYDPVELGFLVLKVRKKRIVGLEPYML